MKLIRIAQEITLQLVRLLEHDHNIISLIVIKEFPFTLQVCYHKEICRKKLLYFPVFILCIYMVYYVCGYYSQRKM